MVEKKKVVKSKVSSKALGHPDQKQDKALFGKMLKAALKKGKRR